MFAGGILVMLSDIVLMEEKHKENNESSYKYVKITSLFFQHINQPIVIA